MGELLSCRLQSLGLILVGLILASCAGQPVSRVTDIKELTKELPKEMQARFEVRDAAPIAATPSTSPKPLAPVVKAKAPKKAPVAKGAFVYPNRRPQVDPIWVGEKHTFEITYFGVVAGDFTVEVLPFKEINSRKVYHVRGNAISSKVFSLFYKLNDSIETFFDYEGLFSHRFHIVLEETKQTRDSLELNDSEKAQTYYWNRWNHYTKGHIETKEFQPIKPFPQDSVSALYYLRTLPMPENGVMMFPVVSEGKVWDAVVSVVRREQIETPLGKMNAVVLKPETKYQGVLQKKGDSFLWLSDDDRRLVLRLEAQVRIGTVVAKLKSVELGEKP